MKPARGRERKAVRVADGIEIGPANLARQYSSLVSSSRLKPSSAMAFSNFGSSFAHSAARRLRSSPRTALESVIRFLDVSLASTGSASLLDAEAVVFRHP